MAMTLMAMYVVFLLGIAIGVLGANYRHRIALKKIRLAFEVYMETADKLMKKRVTTHTPSELDAHKKLNEAIKLSQEQYDLMQSFDYPSKSASHSKYKNQLASKIKELEEQKCVLLQQVLDSGYNPTITVIVDGEKKDIKLEEYLVTAGYAKSNSKPNDKTETKTTKEPKLKLVKNNGVKDDATTTTPS